MFTKNLTNEWQTLLDEKFPETTQKNGGLSGEIGLVKKLGEIAGNS